MILSRCYYKSSKCWCELFSERCSRWGHQRKSLSTLTAVLSLLTPCCTFHHAPFCSFVNQEKNYLINLIIFRLIKWSLKHCTTNSSFSKGQLLSYQRVYIGKYAYKYLCHIFIFVCENFKDVWNKSGKMANCKNEDNDNWNFGQSKISFVC